MSIGASLIPKIIRVTAPCINVPAITWNDVVRSQQSFWISKPSDSVSLFGIPYHVSNARTDEWLGIYRDQKVIPDILKMIRALEDSKKGTQIKIEEGE